MRSNDSGEIPRMQSAYRFTLLSSHTALLPSSSMTSGLAGQKWFYTINSKAHWAIFDIDFDELDSMPLLPPPLFFYQQKQRRDKKVFMDYLMKVRPNITVSTVRREISYVNDILDGSKKVGEIHFNRTNYWEFNKKWFPNYANRFISRLWMNSLIILLKCLSRFVVLSEEDNKNWPELNDKVARRNAMRFSQDKLMVKWFKLFQSLVQP